MAGAGYKLFATGDVLTAAQVNTYLMQQTVMVFASSAARTSALSGVLAEGMVSYLQDTNTLEVYDGSAWIGATGDITALTAGTGVSITNPTGPVPTVAIDTAVTADLTTAQTLTNKTLTSPVLTTPSISNINAKGDILVGTADNTLGIITAGSNGDTLVADSSTGTGLRYKEDYAAGKNKIINGDFGIWQRGTSFSNPTNGTYTADRWFVELDGSGYTRTISQQTFTPGTAPVAGYEGQYFYRWNNSVAGTSNTINALSTRLEDIRTFAGQTVTFSFWAKADASRALTVYAYQQSTGGSGTVTTTVGTATLTTSWARYTMTVAIPSLAGITIGTNSNLQIRIAMPIGTTMTCDFWGMQMEESPVATAFQTATGTIQGELAACQRYYVRWGGDALYQQIGIGIGATSSIASMDVFCPVQMRVAPTAVDYSTLAIQDGTITTGSAVPAIVGVYSGTKTVGIDMTVSPGAVAVNRPYRFLTNNSTSAFFGLSAEL
jgi:hypothetical protein